MGQYLEGGRCLDSNFKHSQIYSSIWKKTEVCKKHIQIGHQQKGLFQILFSRMSVVLYVFNLLHICLLSVSFFCRLYFVDFIGEPYLKSGLAQAMADEKWHCRHPLTELQVDQRIVMMMIFVIIISVVFVICIND